MRGDRRSGKVRARLTGLLALGILIDAFLVRMTCIPAVLSLLGDKAWWTPRWLDRIVPNVDVEGAKLERQLEKGEEPAPTA